MKKELKLAQFIGTEIWIHPIGQIPQQATLLNFDQFGVFMNMDGVLYHTIKFYPWANIRSLEMTTVEEIIPQNPYVPKPLTSEPAKR